MIRLFLLLILTTLFFQCSEDGQSNSSGSAASTLVQKAFFDLDGYMKTELEQLNNSGLSITKTVSIGDKTETKELENADLTDDLALFQKADINKPAWTDKYRIEPAGNDTSYIAIDSTMRTRHLQILRDENGRVERIEIKRRSGNVLSSGSQELTYRPGVGYRIYSKQVGDLVGNAEVSVVVEF